MYLYLDESGDLGFDFKNKKPSRFFVITLLAVKSSRTNKYLNHAVKRTLEKKINHKRKKRIVSELKGSSVAFKAKKYFLDYLKRHMQDWALYAIVLDKVALLELIENPNKNHIYNQMTHQLLERINFPKGGDISLIIDRSKNELGIKEFNNYLRNNLALCVKSQTKLHISHDNSEKHRGIQAVDMFCHGIARKYEMNDEVWYKEFKEKVTIEFEFKWTDPAMCNPQDHSANRWKTLPCGT